MKSYMAKPGEVAQNWWLVDGTDKVVGRLASEIAMILMGKHRPTYTPHVDTGDFVVVINAEKVALTGKKWEHKKYTWYTGYMGLRSETAGERRKHVPRPWPLAETRERGIIDIDDPHHAVGSCPRLDALVEIESHVADGGDRQRIGKPDECEHGDQHQPQQCRQQPAREHGSV